jgi:hypothetical protein
MAIPPARPMAPWPSPPPPLAAQSTVITSSADGSTTDGTIIITSAAGSTTDGTTTITSAAGTTAYGTTIITSPAAGSTTDGTTVITEVNGEDANSAGKGAKLGYCRHSPRKFFVCLMFAMERSFPTFMPPEAFYTINYAYLPCAAMHSTKHHLLLLLLLVLSPSWSCDEQVDLVPLCLAVLKCSVVVWTCC